MEDNKIVSNEKKTEMLQKASWICGLDSHVKIIEKKFDEFTWAERISSHFRTPRTAMPVKNSYMFCDTLDMTFFYDKNNKPCVTYAGYAYCGCEDLRLGRLKKAIDKADEMLYTMKRLMDDELREMQ